MVRSQKTVDSCQKTEDSGQKTEDRGQWSEVSSYLLRNKEIKKRFSPSEKTSFFKVKSKSQLQYMFEYVNKKVQDLAY